MKEDTQKIAVAIIHGVGKQDPHFAKKMISELKQRFSNALSGKIKNPSSQLVIHPIYWAPVLQEAEDKLWKRMEQGGKMRYKSLRRFMVDFAADALAYQPTPSDHDIYNSIHEILAGVFRKLAREAGSTSPLCVIAHSLGTVIASNYLYDLQAESKKRLISRKIKNKIGRTPLDRGETLTHFYTLGGPIALWSLRYPNFGVPIKVPSPKLKIHHPQLTGEWVNFYDKDDIIGYPLKTLNRDYAAVVKKDKKVNVGSIFTSWNPASHTHYWTDNDVTKPIAHKLVQTWREMNGK